MIRSTMRNILRRRMQDVSADTWDQDSDLDDILNVALHQMQKKVMEVDSLAFMYIARAPLTANEEFYPLPDGFWYELEVGLKLNASAVVYTPLVRGNYDAHKNLTATATPGYDIRGRFITFMPTRTYAASPGFQIQYVPTLSMGTDAVAPDLHQGLHFGVILWAQMLLVGETLESSSEISTLLKTFTDDIPLYYQRGGEAQTLRIDAGQPLIPAIRVRGTGIDHRNG